MSIYCNLQYFRTVKWSVTDTRVCQLPDSPVFSCRLHKEALKQAAIDPTTGKIDVSILTTGISGAARKQRADRMQFVKELIKQKGKVPSIKYNKLLDEYKEKMAEKGEQVGNGRVHSSLEG